jgi:hypothetical protein
MIEEIPRFPYARLDRLGFVETRHHDGQFHRHLKSSISAMKRPPDLPPRLIEIVDFFVVYAPARPIASIDKA